LGAVSLWISCERVPLCKISRVTCLCWNIAAVALRTHQKLARSLIIRLIKSCIHLYYVFFGDFNNVLFVLVRLCFTHFHSVTLNDTDSTCTRRWLSVAFVSDDCTYVFVSMSCYCHCRCSVLRCPAVTSTNRVVYLLYDHAS